MTMSGNSMTMYSKKELRPGLAEITRAIKLKENINKLGIEQSPALTNRKCLSTRQKPYKKHADHSILKRNFNKADLRPRVLSWRIQSAIEKSLKRDDFVEYQPTMTPSKRLQSAAIRAELGEKNPYSTPLEGVTDSFRVALEIVENVYKKYERTLPLHQRPTTAYRQRTKVNKVLERVLGPGESIVPTGIQLLEKKTVPIDVELGLVIPKATSKDYVHFFKEIELTKILERMKKDEINKIDNDMNAEEEAFKKRKKAILARAQTLEDRLMANEGKATTATALAFEEGLTLRKKVQEIRQLNNQIKDLHQNIRKMLMDLDYRRTIQRFQGQIAPFQEQGSNRKSGQTVRASQEYFETLYHHESLDDGLSGVLEEDIAFLEGVIQWESHNKKPVYFENPDKMVEAFQMAETINLKTLQNNVAIQLETKELFRKFITTTEESKIETAMLEKKWNTLLAQTEQEEHHAIENETIIKLFCIGGSFDEADRVKLLTEIERKVRKVLLEIFDIEDSSLMTMPQLLLEVELLYVGLLDEIDFMPQRYVHDLKAKIISGELERIKQEELQCRLEKEYKILSLRMLRAMAPLPGASERRFRMLKPRSAPPLPKPNRRRKNGEIGSSSEMLLL